MNKRDCLEWKKHLTTLRNRVFFPNFNLRKKGEIKNFLLQFHLSFGYSRPIHCRCVRRSQCSTQYTLCQQHFWGHHQNQDWHRILIPQSNHLPPPHKLRNNHSNPQTRIENAILFLALDNKKKIVRDIIGKKLPFKRIFYKKENK